MFAPWRTGMPSTRERNLRRSCSSCAKGGLVVTSLPDIDGVDALGRPNRDAVILDADPGGLPVRWAGGSPPMRSACRPIWPAFWCCSTTGTGAGDAGRASRLSVARVTRAVILPVSPDRTESPPSKMANSEAVAPESISGRLSNCPRSAWRWRYAERANHLLGGRGVPAKVTGQVKHCNGCRRSGF